MAGWATDECHVKKLSHMAAALVLLLVVSAPALGRTTRRHHRAIVCHAPAHPRRPQRCHTIRRRRAPSGTRIAARTPHAGFRALEVGARGTHCDLYAAPSGSDLSGDGSLNAPLQSIKQLDGALAPGQTGCLRAGTYGDVNTWQQLTASGSAAGRLTLTAYPGETARIDGWVDMEGDYTTLSHLEIDGANTLYKTQRTNTTCGYPVSQGLAIAGHDNTLEYDDYYQSVASLRGNGIGIGWWGDADNTVIRYDRIHDVGGCDFYDHLIYLAHANNVRIYDNWLWNDAHGWGIKLDPGPTNTKIWGNVIDAAGSGFNFGNSSGTNPTAGNEVFHNVVINSQGVNNPDIGWSHPGVLVTSPGLQAYSTGNTLHDNVSYNNPGGVSNVVSTLSSSELSVSATVSTNPRLTDPAKHDYAPSSGSPVADWGLWNGN
ncbi:MAG: hypothetical protein ACYC91_09725 [Solirubrobacteraceae bacterium]